MTASEAIRILDPDRALVWRGLILDADDSKEVVDEACRLAIKALGRYREKN